MIVLAIAGVLLAVLRVAARHIVPSISYSIRAEFDEMPSDDELFRQWIEGQPGVYRAFVNRDRRGIEITWKCLAT